MDTKSPSTLLRRQLESLGARVETFFSKDIWCVITDKQLRDQDKRGIGLLSKVISQNSSTSSPNPGGKVRWKRSLAFNFLLVKCDGRRSM